LTAELSELKGEYKRTNVRHFCIFIICFIYLYVTKRFKSCHFLKITKNALTAKVNELEAIALRGERFNSQLAPAGNEGDRQCCTIDKLPTSCQDLKQIGHVLSGFYTVKGVGVLQNVYCDFTKNVNGTGTKFFTKFNYVLHRTRKHTFKMKII
jgi:hypothetical protein